MQSAIIVVAFLLGLSIGSFINAWSFRYGTSRSILNASSCFSCNRKLRWFELVPLVSFLALRGKCRACRASISLQYPIVELATGIVFVLIFLKDFDFSFLTTYYLLLTTDLVFWSLLIAISVYDVREKIIPNGGACVLAAIGFLSPLLYGNVSASFDWRHLVAGPLLSLPLAAFWFFSRGTWMGLGDAKLELGLGWFLGLSLGLSGMLVAFWLGALVGVCLIILGRVARRFSFGMKSELPFGPFLAVGAFAVWFFNFNITYFLF